MTPCGHGRGYALLCGPCVPEKSALGIAVWARYGQIILFGLVEPYMRFEVARMLQMAFFEPLGSPF